MLVTRYEVEDAARRLVRAPIEPVAHALAELKAERCRAAVLVTLGLKHNGLQGTVPWMASMLRLVDDWRTFLAVAATADSETIGRVLTTLLLEQSLPTSVQPAALALVRLLAADDGDALSQFVIAGAGSEDQALMAIARAPSSPSLDPEAARLRDLIQRILEEGMEACFDAAWSRHRDLRGAPSSSSWLAEARFVGSAITP